MRFCQKITFFSLASKLILLNLIKILQAMKRVTLQFPDLYLLWSFAKTLDSNNLEINTATKILICNCSDENVVEATGKYKATVVTVGS